MTTFDPLRKEELRIMGWGDVLTGDADVGPLMGKRLTHDGQVDVTQGRFEALAGDIIVEYANGATEVLNPNEWESCGYLLMPAEATALSTEPVELAEPVGLLQRDESKDESDA